MASAAILRRQIEAALEQRIPAALTPAVKVRGAVQATGIRALDGLLSPQRTSSLGTPGGGGLPEGAVSELVGPECSGRTAVALKFVAGLTREGKVCAWVDVTDSLDPVSAAAAGVDLRRMLWVRCGVSGEAARERSFESGRFKFQVPEQYFVPPVAKKGLHGGGFGAHPRNEVKGMAGAVGALEVNCAKPVVNDGTAQVELLAQEPRSQKRDPGHPAIATANTGDLHCAHDHGRDREGRSRWKGSAKRPWGRMEQAMRAADLLLQAGGFGAVVIDMGGLPPESVSRVPLATWFRYRAAAERTRASVVLLTQVACAKSSAEVVLRMEAEEILAEPTVFAGLRPRVEVVRRRFEIGDEPENRFRSVSSCEFGELRVRGDSNVVSIRKPPQRETGVRWQSRTVVCG